MAREYELQKFSSGMHYIMLDAKTISTLTKNNNTRAVCKLNDLLEFHCAVMAKKEGGHFVNIGLKHCKKLNFTTGSKVSATFVVDETAYQFEMPEKLKEVLDTDEKANKVFHSLTPGNQRGLIYLVSQVKSTDKKIERSLKISDALKSELHLQK